MSDGHIAKEMGLCLRVIIDAVNTGLMNQHQQLNNLDPFTSEHQYIPVMMKRAFLLFLM